ncbi:MAG: hypothetical protein JKX85_12540 [Phycisphaeraceae bacterium]|nr:hypothetical protein [Phycisphaeraceae bacterium]
MMLKQRYDISKPNISSFYSEIAEVEPMKQTATCLMMILGLGLTLTMTGCNNNTPMTNVLAKKGTQVALVRKTVQIEPRRVVEQALNTLNQLQLKNIKPIQTAVDAVIEFTSARSRNYRLIVTGTGLNRTRIEIMGLKHSVDKEQANLIYDEIQRSLFTNQ